MDSGLGRGGGVGCLLGCPSAFSYCVGPGGVSECLCPLVGKVESQI